MLSLSFYTDDNNIVIIHVSEKTYERLAIAGLGKVAPYVATKMNVEGEEYEVNAAKLDFSSRLQFNALMKEQLGAEPADYCYSQAITTMMTMFDDHHNSYFSYE